MRERPRFVLRRAYDRIKEKADALQLASKNPPSGPSFLYQPAFAEDKVIRLPSRLTNSSPATWCSVPIPRGSGSSCTTWPAPATRRTR